MAPSAYPPIQGSWVAVHHRVPRRHGSTLAELPDEDVVLPASRHWRLLHALDGGRGGQLSQLFTGVSPALVTASRWPHPEVLTVLDPLRAAYRKLPDPRPSEPTAHQVRQARGRDDAERKPSFGAPSRCPQPEVRYDSGPVGRADVSMCAMPWPCGMVSPGTACGAASKSTPTMASARAVP